MMSSAFIAAHFRSAALLLGLLVLPVLITDRAFAQPAYSERVQALLRQMSVTEKAGQLNLQAGHDGPEDSSTNPLIEQAVREGKVGGVLNITGAKRVRDLQEIALTQSRLKIPLLVGLDVVHGYRTIFPVPIGQAASFNLDLIRRADTIAAIEATASGINWTFAPVLDMGRDPRWGRMVETTGESPWYTAAIARARVEAFQGQSLSAPTSMLACAKHFVGNGATEGGREYTAVNLSLRSMRENELPPFEAAIKAGIGCIMPAFNAVDGVPGILNRRLLTEILRKNWQFNGLVVTDHGAIAELPRHGVAADLTQASVAALQSGVDMDMASMGFGPLLPQAVASGAVDERLLDQAVLRVLDMKERLGLFDQPFARNNPEREKALVGHPDHATLARQLAEESFVLLKNDKALLPFASPIRSIALIGPFAGDGNQMMGPWDAKGIHRDVVGLHEGLKQVNPQLVIRKVTTPYDNKADPKAFKQTLDAARTADRVVLMLGEQAIDSGEASSRAAPGLHPQQLKLVKAVAALHKPFVVIVMAGRPLVEPALYQLAPSVIQAWFPGSRGGEALARLLFGLAEPLGHLPVTIPRSIGQIPLNHDKRPTGRPSNGPPEAWATGYIDESTTPQFPFGFGLTFTQFDYAAPEVIATPDGQTPRIRIRQTVTNTGSKTGTTLVQLYVRQRVAAVSQPEKQLRGFVRLTLKPGERADAILTLERNDLTYWSADDTRRQAEGWIDIMTGPDAGATRSTAVRLD